MQPEKMQAELDKVVSALGDFYASESQLFEKDLGERTFNHRLAVHVEKQFERVGRRLRLQSPGRADAAASEGNDCLDRRR